MGWSSSRSGGGVPCLPFWWSPIWSLTVDRQIVDPHSWVDPQNESKLDNLRSTWWDPGWLIWVVYVGRCAKPEPGILMIGAGRVPKQWLWPEPLYIRDPTLTPVPSPALSLFGHYGNPQTSSHPPLRRVKHFSNSTNCTTTNTFWRGVKRVKRTREISSTLILKPTSDIQYRTGKFQPIFQVEDSTSCVCSHLILKHSNLSVEDHT